MSTRSPIAWIIEPQAADTAPYMTLKSDVAEKRAAKGDIVTPYHSMKPTTDKDDDEL